MGCLRFSRLAAVLISVLFLGACAQSGAIEAGDAAPDFTLTDINGNKVNLSDFKGKVIILDFFASWCPPCKQEIPDFIALQESYGPEAFTMVGVALVSAKEAKRFAQANRINYPVLIDDEKASSLYGPIRSIPTTFVIDANFKVSKIYIGYRPKDVFEKDIKELLK